ncbi:hypothetical protein [Rhodoferax sediminis]|jgi:hypothetical protein|uniref:GlsB/YeaQ/YmgE family stress response membrane protein n=1 Tax=Rhodoferax sediminis TaxID=2509614 RepID=A0A515DEZ1_9BURK|nr:hypothetical protein [Rhodoferax sediminis]QDL38965.1 hypothetical protein EUB48_17940 [Rhodoferax sediminis]
MHKPLWIEGLSDAIGFVGGALLGYGLARVIGLDPLAPGYETATVFGIVLVGLGGGMGLQLARRWRAASRNQNAPEN